jgi:hypothetical protein
MLDLSYEELDKLIFEICSGRKVVPVKDSTEQEKLLLFKHLSPREQELAEIVHSNSLKEAVAMELPSIEEMSLLITKRGLFTAADEAALDSLEKKLAGQRVLLAKTTRVPANRERINKVIQTLEEEISKVKFKKDKLFEFTRERKAVEQKLLYATWCGVYDPFTDKRYWDTYEEFVTAGDPVFRRNALVEYTIFSHGINHKVMRYIARSNLWRICYSTALKTGESLFGRPISEYTVDQKMVCYWSHYYQSIYEMLSSERPPDTIIEDDEALDAYMKDWFAEKNRDETASRSKTSKYGTKTAWDYQETLVMKSNEIYDDVEYSKTLKEKGSGSKGSAVDAAPMGRKKN